MRVCLGGTFDRLHIGHEALLAKAFEVGDEVFIGLTSDRLAARSRARRVRPYAERKRALDALLRRKKWSGVVAEIDHPFGRSTDPRYQGIVVSPETLPRTVEINAARRRKRLKPLAVFPIGYMHGEDGLRVSATRIAAGLIDARGRRRKPLQVAVGTANGLKVRAVRDAFRRAFPHMPLRVRGFNVKSGVPAQPLGGQTYTGAANRARRALSAWPAAEYGVGVEAGLFTDPLLDRIKDVQYAVVLDRSGVTSAAHGGGFYYPAHVTQAVLKGKTISAVVGPLAGDKRIGSTRGAVGWLSHDALTRKELTEQGVLLALLPRIRPDLYDV